MSSNIPGPPVHNPGNGVQVKRQDSAASDDPSQALKQEKEERKPKPLNRVPRKLSPSAVHFHFVYLFRASVTDHLDLFRCLRGFSLFAPVLRDRDSDQLCSRMHAGSRKCAAKARTILPVVAVATPGWNVCLRSRPGNRL